MLTGIVISSLFTAIVTSELSSEKSESDVRALADFSGKRMCSTGGYWQSDPLIKKNRKYFGAEVTGSSLADCMEQMRVGAVDAVYYDRPPMEKYVLDKEMAATFVLTPDVSPLQLTPVFPDAFNPRFGPPAVLQLRNECVCSLAHAASRGTDEDNPSMHFTGQVQRASSFALRPGYA